MIGYASIVLSAVLLTGNVLQGAESTKPLTQKELHSFLQNASTSRDHHRLGQYYRLQAEKLEIQAKEHADLSDMYVVKPTTSSTKHPMAPDTAEHRKFLADNLAKAATEARAMSAAHEAMAKN